jgi:hypothetical protein
MIRRMRIVLLVPAVLLLAVVVGHRPAKAAQTGTSRGVTLIQLGCGQSPNGPVSGPSTIGVSTGGCDNNDAAGGFRLPSGTLYNLRAQFGAFTTDTMPPSLKVMIYTSASRVPVLVCEATIDKSKCEDLTHQGSVVAGDSISATISIPDGNTSLGQAALTIEENIIE